MRLKIYRFFEIMNNHYYYLDFENEFFIKKISENIYLPANRILSDLIHFSKRDFKVSFLFSGVVLDQFELYDPEMLDSYKALIDTGCVELLSGTYSNSFSPLLDKKEYYHQVKLQKDKIKSLFGKIPLSFPDPNLYNFNSRLTYPPISLLSGNGELCDNISLSVNGKSQIEWLLKPEKLIKILNTYCEKGINTINLFIPYYLFGDSQNKNGDILEFLETFPITVLSKSDYTFGIPYETETDLKSRLQIEHSHKLIGNNTDLSNVFNNDLMNNAFEKLYSLSEKISRCDDPLIKKDWLYLQTCDHFYFMDPELYEQDKSFRIFIPYSSPYFAYLNYMNILMDFSDRLEKWLEENDRNQKGLNGKILNINKDNQASISLKRVNKLADLSVNKVKGSNLKTVIQ